MYRIHIGAIYALIFHYLLQQCYDIKASTVFQYIDDMCAFLQVDGELVNVPVNYLKDVKVFKSGANMVIEMANGVIVQYDGNYKAKVTVPGEYRKLLCGLCGNFDGNSNNDWQTKHGQPATGRSAGNMIGNSYQIAQDIEGDRR